MKKILDFRNRSYSDVSGKYQNMEKPLKHQRRLRLLATVIETPKHWSSLGVSIPGGGGTFIFSACVGLDPASTVHPKKISGISFKHPRKIFEILATKEISQFCTLTSHTGGYYTNSITMGYEGPPTSGSAHGSPGAVNK